MPVSTGIRRDVLAGLVGLPADAPDLEYAARRAVEVEDLIEAVWDRGFDSPHTFRRIAEPFVARRKPGPDLGAPEGEPAPRGRVSP
jgi:hypothetical protein